MLKVIENLSELVGTMKGKMVSISEINGEDIVMCNTEITYEDNIIEFKGLNEELEPVEYSIKDITLSLCEKLMDFVSYNIVSNDLREIIIECEV